MRKSVKVTGSIINADTGLGRFITYACWVIITQQTVFGQKWSTLENQSDTFKSMSPAFYNMRLYLRQRVYLIDDKLNKSG